MIDYESHCLLSDLSQIRESFKKVAFPQSIFYPGNPLHGGAVLIRKGRIISAANVLPVSAATVADKKPGTRHAPQLD